MRFRRDRVPLLERATSIYVPTGRWPARGYLLLPRKDYNELDKYSTTLQLEIGDPRRDDNVATIKNLAIVQAQCVTHGLATDEDAIYLIEVTDGRGIVYNDWFQFPLTEWYNIRAPAYPNTFFPDSMNGGTTWTWETMLEDIWEQMGTHLGPWPGLPSGVTFDSTPEGFWFPGVPAWTALCDVLDHQGLTVACDLTSATPYTIVRPGNTDTVFDALQTKYKTHLEDDLEWIDTGAGRVPKTVKVLFRRRNEVYGTEETVRYDSSLQWSTNAIHIVSATAPATFVNAVGTHYLWSDFTVRYDMDGNALASDVTTANAIAQEQVTEYFATIYRQTAGFMSQVYAGALPFKTGSLVDGVRWYQDYSNQQRQGWKTEIIRGAQPPWRDIWD